MKAITIFIHALFLIALCSGNLIILISVTFFYILGMYGIVKIFGAKNIYRAFYKDLQNILKD
jgi:hypothetical protein